MYNIYLVTSDVREILESSYPQNIFSVGDGQDQFYRCIGRWSTIDARVNEDFTCEI